MYWEKNDVLFDHLAKFKEKKQRIEHQIPRLTIDLMNSHFQVFSPHGQTRAGAKEMTERIAIALFKNEDQIIYSQETEKARWEANAQEAEVGSQELDNQSDQLNW